VQVYFGTDRNVANTAGTVAFGTRRGAGITYGTVRVSVPPGHKLGEIELPHLPLMHPDERHHFVLQGITPFADARQFFAEIRRLNRKTAFVFVHGYNVSFHDAALRTAQLSVDLDVGAVPTFYSWPSQAALQKYPVDSEMAEWTEANLRTFLAGYARDSGVEAIVLIAHSMGSRPATRALATLMQQEPALATRYRMLVLAAPDIDADVFRRDLLPVYVRLNKPVTLYASSNDRALAASRRFNGAQRAGDSRPLPTLAPGLETVDASNVDTDFLGHSYIAESRVLLTDLALLIGRGLAAKDRPGLAPVQSGEAQFWQFRR
jgi:esterase/lipase superfamily enzyme